MPWPGSADELVAIQDALRNAGPPAWSVQSRPPLVVGCFACFPRGRAGPGKRGDHGWSAAVAWLKDAVLTSAVVTGAAGAPYEPGLLALREGPLLEDAVRAAGTNPDVLLVNATGRDHPRRAGLALHLGAILELPTVGVTHRPLLATGAWPEDHGGAAAPLVLEGGLVGYWLRTRRGTRPLAVHAAWRTDPETALAAVRACLRGHRTPEPIRLARTLARQARAAGTGNGPSGGRAGGCGRAR